MKQRLAALILASLVLLAARPVAAQAVDPVQALTREVRVLRKELQTVRKDLNRARTEVAGARKQGETTQAALNTALESQRTELQRLRSQAGALTGAVVLLGGIACLALIAATRKRAERSEPRGLAEARSRIAQLRAQLQSDEARLAELQHRDHQLAG